ncbi:outer membrane beta-barrel protein, partial [Bacillus safensis]|nr:outer membrane beta-barrel protein [Bacillus safensis]
ARVGYAVDRFMPYLAGGVAFGNIKNSGSIDNIGSFSESKTLTGWTAGAGVDYAATDNLIVRLEYRYTDYGDKDIDFGGLNINRD